MQTQKNMKAWILESPKKLVQKEIPVPTVDSCSVLIRIEAACMCNGSDPGIFNGHEAYSMPMVFGHEASGVIVEAGSDVQGFVVGDRVCWWCEMGAFAEYQAVDPSKVAMFLVPPNLTIDETPVLELVIAACRALMALPPERFGNRLAVCGLGPSGLVLIQYAKYLGYQKVIGWDLYPDRRNLALELGADAVFDPALLSPMYLNQMGEVDVAVDMMGDDKLAGEPTITALMRIIRKGGLLISYGHPESGRKFSPFVFQSRELVMMGPVNDMNLIREKGSEVMQAVADGYICIKPIITHRISFDDFKTAFDHMLINPEDQIKVILTW